MSEHGEVYDGAELFVPEVPDFQSGVVPMVGWDLARDVMFGVSTTADPDRFSVIVHRPLSHDEVTTWFASRDQVRDYARKLLALVNNS